MDQLLEQILNPRWVTWLAMLFLLRAVYRVVLENMVARIGQHIPILNKFYGESYHKNKSDFIHTLIRDDRLFQMTMLQMNWARTRTVLCFPMALLGVAFIISFKLAEPNFRIFLNITEALVIITMCEQYAHSVKLKRDLEASLEFRR